MVSPRRGISPPDRVEVRVQRVIEALLRAVRRAVALFGDARD